MSQNLPYDLQLLWDKTNFGLSFWHEEFSSEIANNRGKVKGFKVRSNDDSGSCHITKSKKTGLYFFKDFGGESFSNIIDYVMNRDKIDFPKACNVLFKQYQLPCNDIASLEPTQKWINKITLKENAFKVDKYTTINSKDYFRRIVPFYTDELVKEYNFHELKGYEYCKFSEKSEKLYQQKITAITEYPIFGYVEKEFTKLYAPSAPKGHAFLLKHSYIGLKPERKIYGWDNAFSKVDLNEIQFLLDELKDAAKPSEIKNLKDRLRDARIDIFICTGGSDGMNVASLGYNSIWFNSETERLNKYEYNQLKKIANNIYYIPDLDKTGIDEAVKLGLEFLDIKIVFLPNSLKEQGKKDIANWVQLQKYKKLEDVQFAFTQLLSQALPFKFWEYKASRGNYSIEVNNLLQFLKYNGFYKYAITLGGADRTRKKEEIIFVQIKENIINEVSAINIKDFVLQWLQDNFINPKVQAMIIKSPFFNEKTTLLSLENVTLNTKNATEHSQYFFFKNKAVQVTKTAITEMNFDATKTLVWNANILDRVLKLQQNHFRIFKDINDNWDIEIFDNSSNYLKVLINTSRVYWQKDVVNGKDSNEFNITSKNLSSEENYHQKLQLIAKIFFIGHNTHNYKMKSKAYMSIGIDRSIGKNTKDNKGGSGKSAITEMLFNYRKNVKNIDGRTILKDDPKFMLDGVSTETDILYFEDLTPYFDVNSLFNYVTGGKIANHKGGKMFDVPFEDFPKVILTMNAVPYDITESLSRRMIIFECCNYYHAKSEEFEQARTIADSFNGKELFRANYPSSDWLNDDNFVLQSLQFYLNQNEKIEFDSNNLMLRNYIQLIGDKNYEFFQELQQDEENIKEYSYEDTQNQWWVNKKKLHEYYKSELGQKAVSSHDFKNILELYYTKVNKFEIVFKKKKIDGITTANAVEHFTIITDNSEDSKNKIELQEKAEIKEEQSNEDLLNELFSSKNDK
jgi:hypothetical protein